MNTPGWLHFVWRSLLGMANELLEDEYFSSCSEPFQHHLLIEPILLEQLTSQKTPIQPMKAHGLYSRSDLTPEHPASFVISCFEIPAGLPMSPSNPVRVELSSRACLASL